MATLQTQNLVKRFKTSPPTSPRPSPLGGEGAGGEVLLTR